MVQNRSRIKDSNDGMLALVILAIVLGIVIIGAVYLYKNQHLLGATKCEIYLFLVYSISLTFVLHRVKSRPFVAPPDKDAYLAAKDKLDPNNPADLDELKKLLVRRAISTIPMILSLQNDGNSIERLYKKGMLTDDMHFRVNEVKTYVDAEYADITSEAEDFKEGWGQGIWQQAMHLYQLQMKQMEERNAAIAAGEDPNRIGSQPTSPIPMGNKSLSPSNSFAKIPQTTPNTANISNPAKTPVSASKPVAAVVTPQESEEMRLKKAEKLQR